MEVKNEIRKNRILDQRHFYVNSKLECSRPEDFCYNSLHEAAEAILDGTAEQPSVIYLEPGVYWTGGTATRVGLIINKNWLTLEGLGDEPEDVVIADNRGHMVNAWPADGGANSPAHTMIVNGNGFHGVNLTIGNYLNLDLEYPRDPSENRKKYSDVITQAYALGSQGKYDCWMFENCHILGMLDTLSFSHRRVFFHGCTIRGTKDFIGGGDYAVYENCRIDIFDTCPMYKAGEAATLYRNCRMHVELEDFDTLYLTKFGGQLILDHCSFDGNVKRIEWELETRRDARCYYRDVTLNGEPVKISGETPWNSVEITEEMEASFSAYNLLCSDDGWNPANETPVLRSPVHIWLEGTDRLLYGETGRLTVRTKPAVPPETLCIESEGPGEWEWQSGSLAVTAKQPGKTEGEIRIKASCKGVYGIHTILAFPVFGVCPKFIEEPVLKVFKGEVVCRYKINELQEKDCTEITWYRKRDGRILAVSRDEPCKRYHLMASDIDSEIEVRIIPRGAYSAAAEEIVLCSRKIEESDITDRSIRIEDFKSFPTVLQARQKGDFFIDAYRPLYQGDETAHVAKWEAGAPAGAWTYGRGRDGAKGCWGLTATARGAALIYCKGLYRGPVKVTAVFCPDKDTGEGFGSANGQFTEVLIKYNSETRTGYGLRIERVPEFANGCAFSLRRYENGTNRCLTKPVLSSAYMPSCTVVLEAANGMLNALVCTDWEPQPAMAKRKKILHRVKLSAPYEENGFGDVEIHHTGTVPIGNRTTVAKLVIEYKI